MIKSFNNLIHNFSTTHHHSAKSHQFHFDTEKKKHQLSSLFRIQMPIGQPTHFQH